MYTIVFLIPFALVLWIPLFLFFRTKDFVPSAKAGKVSKFCLRYALADKTPNQSILVSGQPVSIEGMLRLVVCGNSMRDYQIHDGQEVYVVPFETEEARTTIQKHPVLVFDIVNASLCESRYKLRKFVDYVSFDSDWTEVYERNLPRIKVAKDRFVEACEKKVQKLRTNGVNGQLALSETYNEDTHSPEYSLHAVLTIRGAVKYAV